MNTQNALVLSFFSLLLIFGCSNDEKNEELPKTKNIHSLLFIDKSISIDFDDTYAKSKFDEAVSQILNEGILKIGDKIDAYYIHENTLKGRCLTLTSTTEFADLAGLNDTDKEMSQLDNELQINKERNIFKKKISSVLNTKNIQDSNKYTDISASLQIMNSLNTGEKVVAVYFFSDMIESTKSGRDFHKNPPTTVDQATTWAEEDAQKYTDINLNGIIIKSILPFDPLSSSKVNNPKISTYWKVLFESLGVSSYEEI